MSELERFRRRAASEPDTVLLEDSRSDLDPGGRSLFFGNPVEMLQAHALDDLPELFRQVERARHAGLWAAGYASYECGYHWEPTAAPGFAAVAGELPLASFGLYPKPTVFTPEPSSMRRAAPDRWTFGLAAGPFARKVQAIHRWIEAGDTYQANLTDCFHARISEAPDELFARMMDAQPVAFGALLHFGDYHILSAAPELFFRRQGRRITVRPMKGTAARGRDTAEDAVRMAALQQDEKNRAENLMIVDLMRSDLGRIAEMGTVRVEKLFEVERFPTLLQMSSEISARLREDVDAYGMFAALFPSGSIVGAPKVRTMQLLRSLEERTRGVYTGAIGFFAPDEEAVFSVAIRTVVMRGREAQMGVGAGITYSSDAAAEYAECRLKADFLREEPFSLIETMRCEGGACALLAGHLSRLEASAAYFGFRFDTVRIREAIAAQFAQLAPAHAWRVRLMLNRAGELAFTAPEALEADAEPMRAMLWPQPVCSGDRFLRHKTTRRALYGAALLQARAGGCVDVLFCNEDGLVTEGAIHSIAVRHGGRWRTPSLDAGVLPGVYRAHLLATMPELEISDFRVEELLSADEIWLMNAVRGIRRVTLSGPAPHAIVEN